MRFDPRGRAWLEAEARLQLPPVRDLEAGQYSADDFIRYDLTDDLLDYLADAFDVLEIIAPNRRRLRVENARTVESFDVVAKASEEDSTLVMPIALSIWLHEPDPPQDWASDQVRKACVLELLGQPWRQEFLDVDISVEPDSFRASMRRMKGMTDEQVLSLNEAVIEEFRSNGGRCGGMFEGNPMLLMTMTGARSGRRLTTPLTYHADGDDHIVMASAGGDPEHPAWYFNLRANPDVVLEVGTEQFDATAVETEGDERTRVFEAMVAAMPRFGEYQDGVDREIPIFKLMRK